VRLACTANWFCKSDVDESHQCSTLRQIGNPKCKRHRGQMEGEFQINKMFRVVNFDWVTSHRTSVLEAVDLADACSFLCSVSLPILSLEAVDLADACSFLCSLSLPILSQY